MNPKVHRIRELIAQNPRLLLDIVYDLQNNPPPVLRPWEPDLTPSDSFFAVRRTLMGDPLVLVRPDKATEARGLWKVTPYVVNNELESQLRQATMGHDGHPRAYKAVLERVDFLLGKHGYTCLDHTYPDIVLGPWAQSSPNRWRRDLKVFDQRMSPEFKITASDNGHWRLFREPGDVVEGQAVNLKDAKLDADKMLIRLGYNMARPTSYAPEQPPKTDNQKAMDAVKAAQNKSWASR